MKKKRFVVSVKASFSHEVEAVSADEARVIVQEMPIEEMVDTVFQDWTYDVEEVEEERN